MKLSALLLLRCEISGNIFTRSSFFRMESILVDMITKIRGDSSRFDDGGDTIKFSHFPVATDEIEDISNMSQMEGSEDMEQILEKMMG